MAPHRPTPLAFAFKLPLALNLALALTLAAAPTRAADESATPEAAQPVAETTPPPAAAPAPTTDSAEEGEPVSRARHVNLDEPISNAEASQSASEPEPETETAVPTELDAPTAEAPTGQLSTESEQTPADAVSDTHSDTGSNTDSDADSGADSRDKAAEPTGGQPEEATAAATTESADTLEPPAEAAPEEVPTPFILLGTEVPPATSTRLAWAPSQSFEGIYSATPVLVVNGAQPGPVLCLTAAVHGDELNGVETVRRVLYNLDPDKLRGTVVGVPIVNLQGFHRSSRYLGDRRDLNRYFPGDPGGSSASRIAYSFFHEIIQHCSAVVDLHTGSFYRTNLPQLRGDLTNPRVVKLTEGFGSTVVVHSEGAQGTLRRAAVEAGIPAVTLEAGAPMVLSEDNVAHSVKGVRTLLNHLDMLSKFRLWGDPEPIYYNSTWQRAPEGGVVFSKVSLGQNVRKGDLLGTVTNPITNVRTEIRSSYNGRIIGMALNQVVQPGFATHHIGIEAPEEQISPPEDVEVPPEVENNPVAAGDSAATPPSAEAAGTSSDAGETGPAGEAGEAVAERAPEAADGNAAQPSGEIPLSATVDSAPEPEVDSPKAAALSRDGAVDTPIPSAAEAASASVPLPGPQQPGPESDDEALPLENAEDEDFEAGPRPLDDIEDDMAEAT